MVPGIVGCTTYNTPSSVKTAAPPLSQLAHAAAFPMPGHGCASTCDAMYNSDATSGQENH